MAVRHEVENLIRRGNIFYWRPRVPAAFTHCQPGSRLSLSLHCSDHRKAQVIGRKLNTRLAELKMNSKDIMSDTRLLQKLFEHIRDGMDAALARPATDYLAEQFSVFPIEEGERLTWIDPAGYVVASSVRPAEWIEDVARDFTFDLSVARGEIKAEPYLPYR